MKTKVDLLLKREVIKEAAITDDNIICMKCYFELTCERKKGMPCMSTMREDKKSIYYREL
jgi:hypothetical protein